MIETLIIIILSVIAIASVIWLLCFLGAAIGIFTIFRSETKADKDDRISHRR